MWTYTHAQHVLSWRTSIYSYNSNLCKVEQWTSAVNEWTVYKCIPAILIETDRAACFPFTPSLCANIYKLIARQYNALINVMPHHLLYGVQWGKVEIWLIKLSILQKVGGGEDYWGFDTCSTSMPFPKTIAVIKMHDLRDNQMPDYSGTSYNRLSK